MATLEEKKAFYASRGFTRETSLTSVDGEPARPMTEEEFDEYLTCFCSDPDELTAREALHANGGNDWKGERILRYPLNIDQIEAAYKGFKYLQDNGIDIGPDAGSWVAAVTAVKEAFPKPENIG